jgi:hypothetical protein
MCAVDFGAHRAIASLAPETAADRHTNRNSDRQPYRHVSGSDPEGRSQRRSQCNA